MAKPKLRKVSGSDCLQYIDKPIAFVNKTRVGSPVSTYITQLNWTAPDARNWYAPKVIEGNNKNFSWSDAVSITRFPHDKTKRIVGFVRQRYDDGGYYVIVLGDEELTGLNAYCHECYMQGSSDYHLEGTPPDEKYKKNTYVATPDYDATGQPVDHAHAFIWLGNMSATVPFYDAVNYVVTEETIMNFEGAPVPPSVDTSQMSHRMLTNDPETTLKFGEGVIYPNGLYFNEEFMNDPLVYLQGDLYDLMSDKSFKYFSLLPASFDDGTDLYNWTYQDGEVILSTNLVAVPYNIILTENLNFAQAYLQNGTLPPDAFLFPLDWENLPSYTPSEDPDDDTNHDEDPDNVPSDFDGDPDLPSVPHSPPQALSPNNYYWLTQYQLEDFFNWFWYDVGQISGIDDILKKIEGLYNDLGSTVLNVRYMPVQLDWIGGAGTPSPIICGMIEKSGNVPTISKSASPIREIGHIRVPKEYNSFASYSPYSECMLYLPYYGFMSIDMDMFTGHDIYIKAIYDHLTGTIQYLIYYENQYLVNSVVAKMAVDIPITLQSKNDRDSAIFSNVSNAVAGLIGAGVSMGTGNPLGLVVGANALNSGIHSAPLTVKGVVGESGAFYAPSHCKLITQFPIEAKPKSFNEFVGKLVNKTMVLKSSELSGYTECYNPRITFNNTIPLLEEEEEIYDYLTKGVIL